MENIFRIELNSLGFVIAGIVLWLFYNQIKVGTKENKIFLSLVYFIIIELVLDSVFWLIDSQQFFLARQLNLLINTFYYGFQALESYIWLRYCENYLEIKNGKGKKYLLFMPFFIATILLVINSKTGVVFFVDTKNIYHRSWGFAGWLETISCLFYPCYMGFCLIKMMLRKKREAGFLLLVSSVPIVGIAIQMLFYGLNFIWIGMALASLLIFMKIEFKQYKKIEDELVEQRIKIMLSQIQPHFLYNSIASIQMLCKKDSMKAYDALMINE